MHPSPDGAINTGYSVSQRLILLMSMPRSGSTWLGKIFDSHPDTLYRHEPDDVRAIANYGLPLLVDIDNTEQYRRAISEFVAALPDIRLTKVTTKLPIFSKSYYTYPQFVLRKFNILATKLGGRFFGELPVPDVVDYRRIPDLPVVWKSCASFGRCGVLCRALEDCRAVLIFRHPCGYIASVMRGEAKRKFVSNTPTHEDYGIFVELLKTEQAHAYGLTLDALNRMHPVERLAWRWVLFNEKAMDDVAGLPNCSYIRYEDLCKEPIAQSRKLFEFAHLAWNEQTEAFIRQSTASEDSAFYSVFKDPLKSAYKWKNELTAADIDLVLAVVKDTKPGRLYAARD